MLPPAANEMAAESVCPRSAADTCPEAALCVKTVARVPPDKVKPRAQQITRPRQPALHRPQRPAQLPGRYLVSLTFEVTEHDGYAVFFRQKVNFFVN